MNNRHHLASHRPDLSLLDLDDMPDEAMIRLLTAIHQEDTMTQPEPRPPVTYKTRDTNINGQTVPGRPVDTGTPAPAGGSGPMVLLIVLALVGFIFGGVMAITSNGILPVIFGCAIILVGAAHSAVALGVAAIRQK